MNLVYWLADQVLGEKLGASPEDFRKKKYPCDNWYQSCVLEQILVCSNQFLKGKSPNLSRLAQVWQEFS